MNPAYIAMLWGLISTIILHISKAMERQGADVFDQIKNKIKKEDITKSDAESREDKKKAIIYVIGLILNNTVLIYSMASNAMVGKEYASNFTSVFGLGLIALLLYSSKVLKEKITKTEIFGAGILILGTLIIGVENSTRDLGAAELNMTNALIIALLWLGLGIIIVVIASKKVKNITLIGVIFGLYAGGGGGLDPVLKALAQDGALIPTGLFSWIIFVISFLPAVAGFWVTQWGFAKKAKASVLVPAYNSMYIVLPIVIYGFTMPTFEITWITLLGLITTISGVVLMQAFKKEEMNNEIDAKPTEIDAVPIKKEEN